MSMISKMIPSDAWSMPIGKPFPKENYPEISFRVPWEQLQMTRDGARQGCPIGGYGSRLNWPHLFWGFCTLADHTIRTRL